MDVTSIACDSDYSRSSSSSSESEEETYDGNSGSKVTPSTYGEDVFSTISWKLNEYEYYNDFNSYCPGANSEDEDKDEDGCYLWTPPNMLKSRASKLYEFNLQELKSCLPSKDIAKSQANSTSASISNVAGVIPTFNFFLTWFTRLKEKNAYLEQFNTKTILEEYFKDRKFIESSNEILTSMIHKTNIISQYFQCTCVSIRHVIAAINTIQTYEEDYLLKPSLRGLPQILKCNYTIDELGRENILGWITDKNALHPKATIPTNYSLEFINNNGFEEIKNDEEGQRTFESWLEVDAAIHNYRMRQFYLKGKLGFSDGSDAHVPCKNDRYEGELIHEEFDCIDLLDFKALVERVASRTLNYVPRYSNNALYLFRRWYDTSMMNLIHKYFKSTSLSSNIIMKNEEKKSSNFQLNSNIIKNNDNDNTHETPIVKNKLKSRKTPSTLEKINKKKRKQYTILDWANNNKNNNSKAVPEQTRINQLDNVNDSNGRNNTNDDDYGMNLNAKKFKQSLF
jgi:hypothetical protein